MTNLVQYTLLMPIGLATIVWVFIIFFVIGLAAALLLPQSNQSPEDGPDPASLEDINLPTAEEERIEPTLYGTRLLTSPNCVWYGQLGVEPIEIKIKAGKKSKKQEVGFAYFLSMLYVIGRGRIKVIDFRMNREQSFENDNTLGGDGLLGIPQGGPSDELAQFFPVTGKPAASNGSGNSRSSVFLLTGNHTDDGGPNDVDNTSFGAYQGANNTDIIHKDRGLIMMAGAFIGDNTTAVPPYSFTCSRLDYVGGVLPDPVIADLDTNPIHVVFDILTAELSIPLARIEVDPATPGSFYDASEVIASEDLGVSFVMIEARTATDWISDILRHIDGFLFFNRQTGKYNIKLIRDDYDPGNLNTIDDSFYKKLQLARRGWDDTFTDLEVRWTSRVTWKERTANFVNDASRSNLGYKKKRIISFPMFTTSAAVANVVARMKKRMFFPSTTSKFTMSVKKYRDTYGVDLNPGDVVRLDIPGLNATNFIMRVTEVGGSTSADQEISVQLTEDLFGLGSIELEDIPDGEFDPPNYDYGTEPPEDAVVKDALAELTDPLEDDAFNTIMLAAIPPDVENVFSLGYRFEVNSELTGQQQFAGRGTTLSTFPITNWSTDDFAFFLDDGKNLEQFVTTGATEGDKQRLSVVVVLCGPAGEIEVIALRDFISFNPTYLGLGIIRGLAGTEIQEWPMGTTGWVIPNGILGATSYQTNFNLMTVGFRAFNQFQVSESLDIVHTHGQTAQTPYPPFNLTAERVISTTVKLTWRGRKRKAGATHVDPDSIPATDEPWEGQIEITASDDPSFLVLVDPNLVRGVDGFLLIDEFIRTGTPVGAHTYSLRTFLNGRYSETVQIVAT